MSYTQDFLKLTELLLIDVSQARSFARTLLQVLLRIALRLAEQPSTGDPGAMGTPSREDMDSFVARMQRHESLDLAEVTRRIGGTTRGQSVTMGPSGEVAAGGTAAAGDSPMGCSPGPDGTLAPLAAASLVSAVHRLAAEAEHVGEHIIAALSSHVSLLALVPISAPSPWASLSSPELKAVASAATGSAAATASVGPLARGLGSPTISATWEALETGRGARLILLWSGGGGVKAELHLCRVHIPPAPLAQPVQPRLDRARISAGSCFANPGFSPGAGHFMLCEMYDTGHVVALALQEQSDVAGGAVPIVCLVDVSEVRFCEVTELSCVTAEEKSSSLPPAISLDSFSEVSVKRSAPLPASYIWASALRAMATRRVCSVYAWRARRLLTLDMEAEVDEDEENEDDAAN